MWDEKASLIVGRQTNEGRCVLNGCSTKAHGYDIVTFYLQYPPEDSEVFRSFS